MPDNNVVVVDTSCLIVLDNINRLDLLQNVYANIIVSVDVRKEFEKPLPEWIVVEEVKDKKYQFLLETQLDVGEASAIALASEKSQPILLLDDLKARKVAGKLGLTFTGTLGVLTKAKKVGVIHEIKPILLQLRNANFHISTQLVKKILKLNDEG